MSGKILIVDDNAQNLQVLAGILAEENYQIEFALSGKEALEYVSSFDFDLFLLDVMMPGMDGYELCRRIKKMTGKEEIPVIFLTAKTDLESLKIGYEAGGVDYITKPFQKEELLLRAATQITLKTSKDELRILNNSLQIEIKERIKAEKILQIQKEQLKEDAEILARLNYELLMANVEIESKHKDLQDSIDYAKLIQNALLPDPIIIAKCVNDYFILNEPLHVVSGDFYWFKMIRNQLIIAVGDCTGHGVPGAFMSILGLNYLNEIIWHFENEKLTPNIILDKLRILIKNTFNIKTGDVFMNGMDISLCFIDMDTLQMQFSGANNAVILFRDKNTVPFSEPSGRIYDDENYNIIKLQADKQPVGYFPDERPFRSCNIQLKNGDRIYFYTDGVIDQFGKDGRKFYMGNFIKTLSAYQNKKMDIQKQALIQVLNDFKGDSKQTDDILVMGIQIE